MLLTLKRLYIFDQVNLQVVIDISDTRNPVMILDWSEEASKLGLLISTKVSQAHEFAGKPVFKYKRDIAILAGKYTLVLMFEDEDKNRVKKILSKIYIELEKSNPLTSNEMGEIAIRILKSN